VPYLKSYVHYWVKSYNTILGQFDPRVDEFYEPKDWLVFLLCTLFNLILLLNLLISIISMTLTDISKIA